MNIPWQNKLSDLKIDEDKDWNGKAVTSMKELTLNSMIKLKGLNADPSVQEGIMWYRGDVKEYRVWRGSPQGSILDRVSTVRQYPIVTDIGLDNNGCIWYTDYDVDTIYKLNRSGCLILSFSTPCEWPYGVDVDSNGCVWHTDNSSDKTYQMNQSGGVISSFSLPSGKPYGLGIDRNDCIWITDIGADNIRHYNQSGSVVKSFSSPSSNILGVDVDNNDCVWTVDKNSSTIYKLDQGGSVKDSFSGSPCGYDMTGIAIDSDYYLWVKAQVGIKGYIFKRGSGNFTQKLDLV